LRAAETNSSTIPFAADKGGGADAVLPGILAGEVRHFAQIRFPI
jgi:hypothetical protein